MSGTTSRRTRPMRQRLSQRLGYNHRRGTCNMAIGREEVRHIAKLANLEFSEDEIDRFTRQFNSILEYVARLNALDTSAIEPTSHIGAGSRTLRDDVLVPSIPRDEALANAPASDRGYFKVPRVIG